MARSIFRPIFEGVSLWFQMHFVVTALCLLSACSSVVGAHVLCSPIQMGELTPLGTA